jgi:hypothetical protein
MERGSQVRRKCRTRRGGASTDAATAEGAATTTPPSIRSSRSPRRGATYMVKKTNHDTSYAQFPTLTRTNYAEWEIIVKVMMKARGLWKVVCEGTEEEEEN